jgi:hypothetical protein
MRRRPLKAGTGPDENGEQVVLDRTRHTLGTGAAAGVLDRCLAELVGHTSRRFLTPGMGQAGGKEPTRSNRS